MLVKEVCEYLDNRFPKDNAEDSDQPRIGLIIGDDDIEVTNILLTLDLNFEVVNKAIEKNCNMIIAHHPFIFEPLYKILFNSPKGKVINLMFKHNISLYVMHTNLDVGKGGVNDTLANMLDLKDIKTYNDYQKGSYLRTGNVNMNLNNLIIKVKEAFELSGVRYLGDLNKKIKTVGIVGGSGGRSSDIINAYNNNCDCYITGEIHLNCSQLAEELGLSLIEVNHGVEKFVFKYLKSELECDFNKLFNFTNKIYFNECETDNMKTL